jgi:hypothetical protein
VSTGTPNWTGRDPRLRLLRSLAFVVILALFAYVVVIPEARDLETLGTLTGLLVVFGGFEGGIRWFRGGPPTEPPQYPTANMGSSQPTPPVTYAGMPSPPSTDVGEWDSP